METREELLRAKIPCPETGIEIKRTLCAICSPSFHCGVDAYVRDGRIDHTVAFHPEHEYRPAAPAVEGSGRKGDVIVNILINWDYIRRENRTQSA